LSVETSKSIDLERASRTFGPGATVAAESRWTVLIHVARQNRATERRMKWREERRTGRRAIDLDTDRVVVEEDGRSEESVFSLKVNRLNIGL
jgi:hypothetical protein